MREDFGVVIGHSTELMALLVALSLNLMVNVLVLRFLMMDLLVLSFLLTWSFLVMALLVALLADSESVLRLNRSGLGCTLNWSEIDVDRSQSLFLLQAVVLCRESVHVNGCWMEDNWWIHSLNDVVFELGH